MLKFIGGVVLLLAFVIQNNFYDRSNSRLNELRAATLERAVVDKNSQLAEVLFFEASSADDALIKTNNVPAQHINRAAVKMAASASMTVLYNEALSSEQKQALRLQLQSTAERVSTFDEYLAFIRLVNESFGKYANDIANQTKTAADQRSHARGAFLFAYSIGTFVLLTGLWFEWRAARLEMVASRCVNPGA